MDIITIRLVGITSIETHALEYITKTIGNVNINLTEVRGEVGIYEFWINRNDYDLYIKLKEE